MLCVVDKELLLFTGFFYVYTKYAHDEYRLYAKY